MSLSTRRSHDHLEAETGDFLYEQATKWFGGFCLFHAISSRYSQSTLKALQAYQLTFHWFHANNSKITLKHGHRRCIPTYLGKEQSSWCEQCKQHWLRAFVEVTAAAYGGLVITITAYLHSVTVSHDQRPLRDKTALRSYAHRHWHVIFITGTPVQEYTSTFWVHASSDSVQIFKPQRQILLILQNILWHIPVSIVVSHDFI